MKYIKQYKINEDTKVELTEDYINDVLQVLKDEGIKYTISLDNDINGTPYVVRFQNAQDIIYSFVDANDKDIEKISLIIYENLKHIMDKLLMDGFGSIFKPNKHELRIFRKNTMYKHNL